MLELSKQDRIIASQREHIEELEETVRQLRDEAKGFSVEKAEVTTFPFPVEWRLTKSHTKMLSALYTSPSGFVGSERLSYVACVHKVPRDDEKREGLLKVQMSRLRKLIAPLGIEIHTYWGHGYTLTLASKAIIKAALERRAGQ